MYTNWSEVNKETHPDSLMTLALGILNLDNLCQDCTLSDRYYKIHLNSQIGWRIQQQLRSLRHRQSHSYGNMKNTTTVELAYCSHHLRQPPLHYDHYCLSQLCTVQNA